MNATFALSTMLLLLRSPAAEDERFDLWRFAAPEGWVKRETAAVLTLVRSDGDQFCQIGIYKARVPAQLPFDKEIEKEWKEVVEITFSAEPPGKLKGRRLASGVAAQGLSANTRDKEKNAYHTVLYVLAPYGLISSIIVNTKTAAGFEKFEKSVTEVLDSLKIDVDAIAKIAPAPGKPEEFPGRWAASSGGGMDRTGVSRSSSKHQYDFKKDGTYTYRREMWGGSFQANQWFLTEERGTYTVEGAKVTVAPTEGSAVVKNREGEVLKTAEPTLEKVTYLWRFHFFSGLGETQLVLTPPGPTDRDGVFASNDDFRSSYLLSPRYAPEWRAFPK